VVENVGLNLLKFIPILVGQKEIDLNGKSEFGRFLLADDEVKVRVDYGMRTEITLDIHPIKLDIGR
jgi:hypothetical protein